MKTKVILITNSFPYSPGEEFLETELKYYEKFKNTEFIIIPSNKKKLCRYVDESIKIDNYFLDHNNQSKGNKIQLLFRMIFSMIFYREVFKNNIYSIKKLRSCASSIISYRKYYELLQEYFKDKNDLKNTIIYTYWNNEITYALQTLKSQYGYKLVSRIHGGDLYKERRPMNYMPLKKQFTKNIDKVYTITQSANVYLHDIYGFNHNLLELSRLGVDNNNITSLANKENILHLISCSFLVEVKRIDKIIEALQNISINMPHINYVWTHIGDGPLYERLLKMANKKLGHLNNINFKFLGNLDNKKVYQFYKNNSVDVFINVSDSEGVPVSIMEAMSCNIPIIAPDIGGISDMVINKFNGFLLSSKSEVNEIVVALENHNFYKNKIIRKNSYNIYLEKFNAEKNYKSFLEGIINI